MKNSVLALMFVLVLFCFGSCKAKTGNSEQNQTEEVQSDSSDYSVIEEE